MASDEHCTHLDPSECDGAEHHYGRASDITDVLGHGWVTEMAPDGIPSSRVKTATEQVAALAAATASGPLVEDVECPTCEGETTVVHRTFTDGRVGGICPTCHGSGTVRIRVTRDDPALAKRLRRTIDKMETHGIPGIRIAATEYLTVDDLAAIVRIIGGEK